jgi:hypothetical protein
MRKPKRKFRPTKKWARQMKEASQKLLAFYLSKEKRREFECPLCHATPIEPCNRCPWVVFERYWCMADENVCLMDTFTEPSPRLRAESIRRHRRWIRRFNEIIKGG